MDTNDLLILSHAVEETKPLGTRVTRLTTLRRSYILLRLAFRAARRRKLDACRSFLDRALPGFCQSNDLVSCTSELLGVYNHLGHQLKAA